MVDNIGRQESTYPSQSFFSRLGRFFSSERGISLISVLVVLLLWFVSTSLEWVDPLFLPYLYLAPGNLNVNSMTKCKRAHSFKVK
ncbi:MAG: hypothetical protein CLLPBCKN_006037 [Chroococcidiopsis cubana SAG 39.79]|nr:hypothetical protein [Chroococcidiopsis cubana SAG 39.79]